MISTHCFLSQFRGTTLGFPNNMALYILAREMADHLIGPLRDVIQQGFYCFYNILCTILSVLSTVSWTLLIVIFCESFWRCSTHEEVNLYNKLNSLCWIISVTNCLFGDWRRPLSSQSVILHVVLYIFVLLPPALLLKHILQKLAEIHS